jgi:hypothetical protein
MNADTDQDHCARFWGKTTENRTLYPSPLRGERETWRTPRDLNYVPPRFSRLHHPRPQVAHHDSRQSTFLLALPLLLPGEERAGVRRAIVRYLTHQPSERVRMRDKFTLTYPCTSPRPSSHPVVRRWVHQDAERERGGRRQLTQWFSTCATHPCTSPRPSPHPVVSRRVHQDAEREHGDRRQLTQWFSTCVTHPCTSPRPSPHPVVRRWVHQDAERERGGRSATNPSCA